MAFNKGDRADASKMRRGGMRRRKSCVFCGENGVIDYKDVNKLKDTYLRGKSFREESQKLCKTSEGSYSSYQEQDIALMPYTCD